MPRAPRFDAPGAAHHVMLRGIERRNVFRDDDDCEEFLARLEVLLVELAILCFAWALMPNHIHLALRSGRAGISKLIARLATAYALYFNRKYDRAGHLFQNRFRSRRIRDDRDLVGVIRYVHRNPLEGGLVSPAELPSFRWCGHGGLVGAQAPRLFHAVSETLALVDPDPRAARDAIARWVESPVSDIPVPLEPHWPRPDAAASPATSDDFSSLLGLVCKAEGIPPEAIFPTTRPSDLARVRRLIALRAIRELGMSGAEVARRLHVSRTAIAKMLAR